MVDVYYVIERMFDTGGATEDTIRYLSNDGWTKSERNALTFGKDDAIKLVKKYRNSFRDYNAQYSIDQAEHVHIERNALDFLANLTAAPTNNISRVPYDFIAAFIVDLRHEPDYGIVHRNYLAVSGGLDADMWYSECVSNTELEHFLETEITGRLKESEIVSGVFKLVYAVTCHSSESNGPDSVEYDSWETYELLMKTELTEEEIKFMLEPESEEYSFEHIDLEADRDG